MKFGRFYQYSECNNSTSTVLLHFDSCPAEAIIVWLTKQMNTLLNQSFKGALGNYLFKKVGIFPEKCQRRSPVLIKLQGNVSKTELRNRHSP